MKLLCPATFACLVIACGAEPDESRPPPARDLVVVPLPDQPVDDDARCEAEREDVCASVSAECGISPWPCGGRMIDCGRCRPGDVCGDDATKFQCGHACDGSAYRSACAERGLPSTYGTTTACSRGAPYLLDVGGRPIFRREGRDGCVAEAGVLCCS